MYTFLNEERSIDLKKYKKWLKNKNILLTNGMLSDSIQETNNWIRYTKTKAFLLT